MLDDHSGGCWEVVTWSSTYLLDLDARTVTRAPDTGFVDGAGQGVAGAGVRHTAMRLDGLPIPLVRLEACEPGRPMRMTVEVRSDGRPTRRLSTPVTSIRRLR